VVGRGISGPLAGEFVIETVIEFAFHQSGSNGLHCLSERVAATEPDLRGGTADRKRKK